jgi:perosamine synthetase
MTLIPLGEPKLTPEDTSAVQQCLSSGWPSVGGDYVDRFEARLAEKLGIASAQVVATTTGTAALHVALRLAGVCSGEIVVLPSLTFVATANAVSYVGGIPCFVDVDDSGCMDVDRVAQFLARCVRGDDGRLVDRTSGRRVAGVVAVHTLGRAADISRLLGLASTHQLPLIEDAAGALGSSHRAQPVGTFGQFGILSFNGNKIVTSGGGGAIITRHVEHALAARHLITQARSDGVRQIHDTVAYNYRLTNLHAALGWSQLRRLDELLRLKRRTAERYDALLREDPRFQPTNPSPDSGSNHWMYVARFARVIGAARLAEVVAAMRHRGVEARMLWQPLDRSPAFPEAIKTGSPNAQVVYERSLLLPSSLSISRSDQEYVVATLTEAMTRDGGIDEGLRCGTRASRRGRQHTHRR